MAEYVDVTITFVTASGQKAEWHYPKAEILTFDYEDSESWTQLRPGQIPVSKYWDVTLDFRAHLDKDFIAQVYYPHLDTREPTPIYDELAGGL